MAGGAAATRDVSFGRRPPGGNAQATTYPDNTVTTSKYTILTFLPLNAWEQLHKAANVYFLLISLIMFVGQQCPQFYRVTVNYWSTAGTLLIMMSASAVIAALDDRRRHMSDQKTNNQRAVLVRPHENKPYSVDSVPWKDVAVGDVLIVRSGEMFPADIVPLASSGDEGGCYVETANLDGETNLKIKTASGPVHQALCHGGLQDARGLSSGRPSMDPGGPLLDQAVKGMADVTGWVRAEAPQKSIHTFTGSLTLESQSGAQQLEAPLGPQQLMLRGTVLRNTAWCLGLVIYTGSETRMVMNSRKASPKYANLEKVINTSLVVVIGAQSLLAFISALLYVLKIDEYVGYWYLFPDGKKPDILLPDIIGFWLTFFVLYSNLMPISLYFTMEVCNVAQSYFIKSDLEMYDKEQDCPANARSTNLGHELGQVSYMFSDKTGTLTQNVMELKQVSVAGKVYGHMGDHRGFQGGSEFANAQRESSLAKGIDAFFEVLAVSHTVVATVDPSGSLLYEAESPDEGALVEAAAGVGWRFAGRSSTSVTVKVMTAGSGAVPETREYKLLALNTFTSDRKRQSVVVQRQSGERVLLVKGADDKMLARASARGKQEFPTEHLTYFSKSGLRTLVLGSRVISDDEWTSWHQEYSQAQKALSNREEKLAAVAEQLEVGLDILGVTAIEDKLQVGVQETIVSVREAGIRLWMLTGDKLETARNIGFSCKVLSDEMRIMVLDSVPAEGLAEVLADKEREARAAVEAGQVAALIVTGLALEEVSRAAEAAELAAESQRPRARRMVRESKSGAVSGPHQRFLRLAELCGVVIACRVSPLQKAEMVRLVQAGVSPTPVTLAIGDGANDVPMIQEASVGIGISGREGRQAVNAADFSIAQFRFLKRLLLVHGRWNYRRTCKFVLYSFWKNTVLVLIMFYYTFDAAFAATSLFEDYTRAMYNFILGPPIIATGIFDRDVSAEEALGTPQLYEVSRRGLDLHRLRIVEMLLSAGVHSVMISVTLWLAYPGFAAKGSSDYYTFGTAAFCVLIASMNYRAAFVTRTWNVGVAVAQAISWVGFIIFIMLYCMVEPVSTLLEPWMYRVVARATGCGLFWICLLAVPMLAMCLDAFKFHIMSEFFPERDILLREQARKKAQDQDPRRGPRDSVEDACGGSADRAGAPASEDADATSDPGPGSQPIAESSRFRPSRGPRPRDHAQSYDFSHPGGGPRNPGSLGERHWTANDTSLVDRLDLRRSGTVLLEADLTREASGLARSSTSVGREPTARTRFSDSRGSEGDTSHRTGSGHEGPRLENRPGDSALAQQRLPGWQFEITWGTVVVASFIVGLILLIFGAIVSASSNSVSELRVNYAGKPRPMHGSRADMLHDAPCDGLCTFDVRVNQTLEPPIYVFYHLSPFYQNYPTYLTSGQSGPGVWQELVGQPMSESQRDSACPAPTRTTESGAQIYPCGTAATSLFNDTLQIVGLTGGTAPDIDSAGVAWASDVRRFDNPPDYPSASNRSWLYERYPEIVTESSGAKDERFVSWMRPESMSFVVKPYGYLHTPLRKGDVLTLQIRSTFPMAAPDASKQFVFTTMTSLGGRSSGFGAFLQSGGALCLLMSLAAFSVQGLCPRQRGQPRELRARFRAACSDSGDEGTTSRFEGP